MKPPRPFLRGLFFGVILTAVATLFALKNNDLNWEKAAADHHFGVYYRYHNDPIVRWAWLDDYVRMYLQHVLPAPSYTPPSTPEAQVRL